MSNVWWRSPTSRVGLLLGSVAVLTIVGQAVAPAPGPAPTTVVVPITSLALVCPALPASSPGYTLSLKAALRDGSGTATMELRAKRTTKATVKNGSVRALSVTKSATGLVLAKGSAASRLVADASITGSTASTRGYATYACQPPSASQWLVGGSSLPGRNATLTIANVDDAAATANVEVWTDRGKSGARSLNGVAIPPRSIIQLSLALVEPGHPIYAVHVIATSGQVSSAIIDRGQTGLTSLGLDAIAPSNEPQREQIVGVIPDGAKTARVAIVSPEIPTTVRVSLLTQDGEFALAGAEAIALDADKLQIITLPDDALIGDVAVIVRADDPVAAGASFLLNLRGGSDLASAVSMAPIYRAASFTVDSTVSMATALLYSDRATTAVVISGFGATQTGTTVYLKARQIARVKLVAGSGTARLITIEPGMDGVVSGAVLLQRASVGIVASTLQPLLSLRGYVAVPPVAPALSR